MVKYFYPIFSIVILFPLSLFASDSSAPQVPGAAVASPSSAAPILTASSEQKKMNAEQVEQLHLLQTTARFKKDAAATIYTPEQQEQLRKPNYFGPLRAGCTFFTAQLHEQQTQQGGLDTASLTEVVHLHELTRHYLAINGQPDPAMFLALRVHHLATAIDHNTAAITQLAQQPQHTTQLANTAAQLEQTAAKLAASVQELAATTKKNTVSSNATVDGSKKKSSSGWASTLRSWTGMGTGHDHSDSDDETTPAASNASAGSTTSVTFLDVTLRGLDGDREEYKTRAAAVKAKAAEKAKTSATTSIPWYSFSRRNQQQMIDQLPPAPPVPTTTSTPWWSLKRDRKQLIASLPDAPPAPATPATCCCDH